MKTIVLVIVSWEDDGVHVSITFRESVFPIASLKQQRSRGCDMIGVRGLPSTILLGRR